MTNFRMVLGVRIDATTYDDATRAVCDWSEAGESRYVCVANVNNVMESHDDPAYRAVMNGADLVTPDGVPLVWALRSLGVPDATRVYGPTLTPLMCAEAERRGIPVGFYGGHPAVLDELVARLRKRFPDLSVAFSMSPPFRALTDEETDAVVRSINESGARLIFVGLGAPKQERWMAVNRGRVDGVMVGVGAAFDFLAGAKRQAPAWMQRAGLEWLFRLATEPRRLWRRYTRHNPRFVLFFAAQLVRTRLSARRARSIVQREGGTPS